MTMATSYLRRARFIYRPFSRFYVTSATRTVDVHSISSEPSESKVKAQPFRTSIDDPVCR